jgi:hypothetical protein
LFGKDWAGKKLFAWRENHSALRDAAEEFSTLVHEIAHLCGAKIYVALACGCA